MQTEDFQKFHDGVAGVMSFYSKDVSRFALDVWWNALKTYDLPAINDAFNRYVVNPDKGQFAPKPADIVSMLEGSTKDAAMRAWVKLDRALREKGPYCDVAFDDALIHRVVQDMGGWIGFGDKTQDEWPFVAKEFESRYQGYRSRRESPDYPRVLMGIASAHNARHGFRAEREVELIGDASAAQRVICGGTEAAGVGFTRINLDMKLVRDKMERVELRKAG